MKFKPYGARAVLVGSTSSFPLQYHQDTTHWVPLLGAVLKSGLSLTSSRGVGLRSRACCAEAALRSIPLFTSCLSVFSTSLSTSPPFVITVLAECFATRNSSSVIQSSSCGTGPHVRSEGAASALASSLTSRIDALRNNMFASGSIGLPCSGRIVPRPPAPFLDAQGDKCPAETCSPGSLGVSEAKPRLRSLGGMSGVRLVRKGEIDDAAAVLVVATTVRRGGVSIPPFMPSTKEGGATRSGYGLYVGSTGLRPKPPHNSRDLGHGPGAGSGLLLRLPPPACSLYAGSLPRSPGPCCSSVNACFSLLRRGVFLGFLVLLPA